MGNREWGVGNREWGVGSGEWAKAMNKPMEIVEVRQWLLFRIASNVKFLSSPCS
jgi:hypothetical protein